MSPATLTRMYELAVTTQRRAQAEYDDADQGDRVTRMAEVVRATLVVVATARGLQASLATMDAGDRARALEA